MSPKSGLLSAVAVSLLVLTGCQKITPVSGASVAATVNGTPVSNNVVDQIAQQKGDPAQAADPAVRKEIVEQLALQMLLADEGVKAGVAKQPDVADQLEFTRQSILAKAFVQDYVKRSTPSDAALKAEYDKVAARMGGVEYRARHILVETEADARDIIAKVKKDPKQFEVLAKLKSRDPGSKDNGGELGWFDARSMVPEFGNAVTKLENGQVTNDPVQTRFGFHVIQREESRERAAPPFEQVKPMLQQQASQDSLKKLLEDMKAKADIRMSAPAAAK